MLDSCFRLMLPVDKLPNCWTALFLIQAACIDPGSSTVLKFTHEH